MEELKQFLPMLFIVVGVVIWLTTILFLLNRSNQKEKILNKKYKDLYKQKKSSEVRTGQITEQFAPFIPDWEHNPKNFKFLGAPIDGISFNLEDSEIVFVEIKSGRARLSENQKKIKEIVEKGNVIFKTFRVSDKYCGYVNN